MMNRRCILISWYAIATFEIKSQTNPSDRDFHCFLVLCFSLFFGVVYSGKNNVCAVTLISFEYSSKNLTESDEIDCVTLSLDIQAGKAEKHV